LAKQVEGLSSITSRPIVRRMADGVLSTAVRGLEIRVGFDESTFEGTGCYLLGAVLEAFFAKYVALNSFTETVIHSHQRRDIARWPARSGRRVLI
jgi:type VI secretion system protein ImpG